MLVFISIYLVIAVFVAALAATTVVVRLADNSNMLREVAGPEADHVPDWALVALMCVSVLLAGIAWPYMVYLYVKERHAR